MIDNEARIAKAEGDAYDVITKPHGHGDVHVLLAQSKLAHQWAEVCAALLPFGASNKSHHFTTGGQEIHRVLPRYELVVL